jgi:hypothetical protein
MKTIVKNALVALSLAGAVAGCSGEDHSDAPPSEESGDLGRVNLNLKAGGNQVDYISYVVKSLPSNNVVRSATVDVSPDVANSTS